MRKGLIAGVMGVVMLVAAASAHAAVRYAEPGGDGPETSCPKSNPCEIQDAVEDPSVQENDEVVVLTGTYDIGSERLEVAVDIDLHGAAGEPPPLIRSSNSARTLDLVVADAPRVSDLRLENTGLGFALYGFGTEAIVERVVAVSSSRGCHIPEAPGLIRDSVCATTGALGDAIDVDINGAGTNDYELRNVTAINTAEGGDGISFETDNLTFNVDARNVIARGGGGIGSTDVSASESGTGSITVDLAHSNYNGTGTGGSSTITPPGTNDNQQEEPQLADPEGGDFHQLPGSPTIDAGASVPLLGSLDFERQPRNQQNAPDIGADEFDRRLKLKVKAKKKQKAKKLKVKVSCPEEECYVTARGRAKAGGEKFKLKKTKRRFLEAGERKKLRLKAKNLDELKQLLGSADGEAKIKVKGTDAGGVKAKKKKSVTLVG